LRRLIALEIRPLDYRPIHCIGNYKTVHCVFLFAQLVMVVFLFILLRLYEA